MDRRTDILDSAETLVRARGFDGFSYADIARDVGIRKPSIHHHFATKADLGAALVRRYRTRTADLLAEIDDRGEGASVDLLAFIDLNRAALAGGGSMCLCVALATSSSSLSDAMLAEIEAFHSTALKWLSGRYGALGSVNAEADAAALLALCEGAQLLARASGDVGVYDRAVYSTRDRLT